MDIDLKIPELTDDQKTDLQLFRLENQELYSKLYAEDGYTSVDALIVWDEDNYDKAPWVAGKLNAGYRVLEINAFGMDGIQGSMIIVGKK